MAILYIIKSIQDWHGNIKNDPGNHVSLCLYHHCKEYQEWTSGSVGRPYNYQPTNQQRARKFLRAREPGGLQKDHQPSTKPSLLSRFFEHRAIISHVKPYFVIGIPSDSGKHWWIQFLAGNRHRTELFPSLPNKHVGSSHVHLSNMAVVGYCWLNTAATPILTRTYFTLFVFICFSWPTILANHWRPSVTIRFDRACSNIMETGVPLKDWKWNPGSLFWYDNPSTLIFSAARPAGASFIPW